ncbi:MAG: DoxX family membrane protein [Archangium sp.]|nr:DoxX family membrane protein [Archangium sp.]MDP3152271.1 DoxX family membrane protein [Archangium sp.]MDP3570667.1 DoxX family membrane protein [Archangium sp.]
MKTILLLGRILFGGYFLFSGLNHFISMNAMAGYAASKGVPMPHLAVAFSGMLILLGGLSVLLGFLPRVGLTLIMLFLVPVTLVMHNFWAIGDPQARIMEMTHFLKNTGLVGAALSMMALPLPWPNSVSAGRRTEAGTDWLTGRQVHH